MLNRGCETKWSGRPNGFHQHGSSQQVLCKLSEPAADLSLITALLTSSACVKLTNHYQVKTEADHPCSKVAALHNSRAQCVASLIKLSTTRSMATLLCFSPFQIDRIHFLDAALWPLINRRHIPHQISRDVAVSQATSSHQSKTHAAASGLYLDYLIWNIYSGGWLYKPKKNLRSSVIFMCSSAALRVI